MGKDNLEDNMTLKEEIKLSSGLLKESMEGIYHETRSLGNRGKLFKVVENEYGEEMKLYYPKNQEAGKRRLYLWHKDALMPEELFEIVKQKNGYWVLDNKGGKWLIDNKELDVLSKAIGAKVITSEKFIRGDLKLGRNPDSNGKHFEFRK